MNSFFITKRQSLRFVFFTDELKIISYYSLAFWVDEKSKIAFYIIWNGNWMRQFPTIFSFYFSECRNSMTIIIITINSFMRMKREWKKIIFVWVLQTHPFENDLAPIQYKLTSFIFFFLLFLSLFHLLIRVPTLPSIALAAVHFSHTLLQLGIRFT